MLPSVAVVGGGFSVQVDTLDVMQLLQSAAFSVSGGMLGVWMRSQVDPYLEEQIVDRFAYDGGEATWAPLNESTKRIRRAINASDPLYTNDRTGQMLEHLINHSEISVITGGAQIVVPGDQGDEEMSEKIRTAQHGKADGWLPGNVGTANTPARPVLVLNATDRLAIMGMLQLHIASFVATRASAAGAIA